MKISKKSIYYLLIVFVMLLLTFMNIFFSANKDLLLIILLLLYVFILKFALSDVYNNIFLISFLICFFVFLVGGQVLNSFFDAYGYKFSNIIEVRTNILLIISLVGLFLGYILFGKVYNNRIRKKHAPNYLSNYYKNARKISKFFFFSTYLFWILTLLDVIRFVSTRGYINYYLDYASSIPAIFRLIGFMAPMSFFIYLATMPTKKDAKIPILLYIFYMILSLGTGRRIGFMTGLIIIFSYSVMRNNINPDKKSWVSKTDLIKVAILLPILIGFMYFFEYFRSENYVGSASDWKPIIGFFVRQGTSINVIKYSQLFSDRLNSQAYYSLYNTIKWLQNSPFNSLLGLDLNFEIGKQSVHTALYGTYLADFVSYFANPKSYLIGMGYGSSYVAELFVDFGYFGVFIGNFIYGVLLKLLLKISFNNGNIWQSAIGLFMLDKILRAPRATFDSFFASMLYFEAFGTLIIIYIIVKSRKQKFGKG